MWQLNLNNGFSFFFCLEWHHAASCGVKKGQQQHGQVVAGQRVQNWCEDQGETQFFSENMKTFRNKACKDELCGLFGGR